ncbi:hypothetical protein [Spiroplasma endosymbiont of Agriotes lineatus]|uniref:hypothetical protein n=1 Tax=Spiroplasma endosymbiont of Agriotes lineatus TaxID=3077930 RepID=UPI0030CB8301
MNDVKTYLVNVLQRLLTELDFNDIDIKISQINYETIKVIINCDNNALLIGKNGYVLSFLQNLSKIVIYQVSFIVVILLKLILMIIFKDTRK